MTVPSNQDVAIKRGTVTFIKKTGTQYDLFSHNVETNYVPTVVHSIYPVLNHAKARYSRRIRNSRSEKLRLLIYNLNK